MTNRIAVAAFAAILFAAPAMAEDAMPMNHGAMDHGAMDMGAKAPASPADAAPSSVAFAAANAKMHEAMAIPFTGDADVDFVRGMIGHHQGAIDMAKIELEHGKDPEIRALAERIVAAQEGEIAMMRAWLAAKGE
ncbi:CopM family metallochaperone [Oharaeibacter diazotrophicus]|uniref:DUF305 family protein family protein n=1 Tax=Oharaeibacter diazotrophicus TaxID=1920512 RepID=A0A4R6RIE1_9HYPH|nr:DUF305 domain-containing protein [Oharaeibacter diazotrophicus]TDP86223.1 DUF305 family protein family protein [Oharaeibacter diazotrophicus]BBE71835.1 hypothetical protein OHA_1_01420 [Pleomorphomonas sp. SM30]GLS78600.1 hypothetical protein GCM10007904_39370 [Oharaeibacter diazotrophicus]